MDNFESIKKIFSNKKLLEQALTRKSWTNENAGKRDSNERLEFLGDAVLEMIVTKFLFNQLPDKSEGFLTALRAKIVNTTNLSKLARKMEVPDHLFLSIGEQASKNLSDSILADTVEAIIGAIFLEKGLKESEKFISKNILFDLKSKLKEPLRDAKTRLQEFTHANNLGMPKYKITKTSGPDHNKTFTIEVLVNEQSMGIGTAKSKDQAEQIAAENALEKKNFMLQ